ncbi:response regulator [Paenibacillus solisilvae]|uniref:Response regulator n=1 Tax=Paenibacillus solisilvae TaxID=2486751 RepID=A0ABW0VR24_9BACL
MMRVLIVDDEFEIREGLRNRFPWAAYGIDEVEVADDGDSALAIALERQPELIVTDIKMNRMSGTDFLRSLTAVDGYDWKAIVISGYDDFDLVKQVMKLGAMDYVLKPINTDELDQVVRKSVDQIRRERMERQNQLLLNNQIHFALPKMREEMLLELIESGYVPYRELRTRHRLETLNLGWMNHESMLLMMLEVDDLKAIDNQKRYSKERELVLFGIGNVVTQTLEEDYPFPFALCLNAQNRWIAVLSCSHQEQTDLCQEVAQQCIRRINQYVKVKVSIAMCAAPKTLPNLHDMFVEADEILEQKAVYGGNQLFTVQGLGAVKERVDLSLQEMDEVLDLVKYGTDEDISSAMDRFVELMQSWGLTQLKDIQQRIFEWLLEIFKKASAAGWQDKSWQKNPIAIWEQLEQYDTLHSLRIQVEKFLLSIALDFQNQTAAPSQIICEAEKILRMQFAESLTLQSVASEVHVTPVWLSKLFKKEKQKTFLESLTDIRMERAKEMLGDVRSKIYQISCQVGYKDPVHFSKLFKKQTGCSPKEYRKQLGISDE